MATWRNLAAAAILLVGSFAWAQAPAPAAPKQKPLMRDFMGINGHTFMFNPELYSPLCRLVRDYHSFKWDTDGDTSADTTFPLARSKTTFKDASGRWHDFAGRPDWKQIYRSWQDQGFKVDASIMFERYQPKEWKDLPADAYKYGKEFASYFGPSGAEKLVEAAEIGNEPDNYDDATYRVVFQNMARGMREADPKLTILTSASAPGESTRNRKNLATIKGLENLYDVINIHTYAHKYQHPNRYPLYLRSYPEDPTPGFRYLEDVRGIIAWRNANAPDKQLWVTEFGWDAAATQAPEGSKWTDVSDEHQAQYIVRAFLVFSAMDLDRAYLYWFNDNDDPTVHESSGVTRFYQPKFSYWAMKHLFETLGDYRFSRIVREDVGDLYVYEFAKASDPRDVIWAAWVPTDTEIKKDVKLTLPAVPSRAERMPMSARPMEPTPIKIGADGQAQFEANGSPLYIHMRLNEPVAK